MTDIVHERCSLNSLESKLSFSIGIIPIVELDLPDCNPPYGVVDRMGSSLNVNQLYDTFFFTPV